MKPEELIQIQNEVFTKIIMDELKRQKAAGTAIGDYLLDKYEIDKQTAGMVKKIVSQEK
jgi:anti-sigma factor ChrR (cupin superfamily)